MLKNAFWTEIGTYLDDDDDDDNNNDDDVDDQDDDEYLFILKILLLISDMTWTISCDDAGLVTLRYVFKHTVYGYAPGLNVTWIDSS